MIILNTNAHKGACSTGVVDGWIIGIGKICFNGKNENVGWVNIHDPIGPILDRFLDAGLSGQLTSLPVAQC